MEKTIDNIYHSSLPPKSFNEVYSYFYKKSYVFAKSYVHDDMAAEDIASEALIKLWEKIRDSKIDYLEPLLLTILKNKSLDYLKHQEVERRAFQHMADWRDSDLSIRITSLEACNPDELFSGEVERIVNETLMQLPQQTRKIFYLSRWENKSNAEIAVEMGLSIKSVEYHISKALKVLRISLKDYLPLFFFIFHS